MDGFDYTRAFYGRVFFCDDRDTEAGDIYLQSGFVWIRDSDGMTVLYNKDFVRLIMVLPRPTPWEHWKEDAAEEDAEA